MIDYTLEIELLSDTAFGMGSGVSAVVDSEIRHDALGLPTLSGRALKGLLVNECSEILFALPGGKRPHWEAVALRLFGQRGEMLDDVEGVFIADAGLAPDLAHAIHQDPTVSRERIIDSLTSIRRQTAMNEMGAPQDETLRAVRVLVKGLTLYAPLSFAAEPGPEERALLAACVMSLRRAGLHRNRGKGKVHLQITDRPLDPVGFSETEGKSRDYAPDWLAAFSKEVSS
jgi:hypothetical protein